METVKFCGYFSQKWVSNWDHSKGTTQNPHWGKEQSPLQKFIMYPKFGREDLHMFCVLMKQKQTCSERILSTMCIPEQARLLILKTSSQWWNMVEGASWYGACFAALSAWTSSSLINWKISSEVHQNILLDVNQLKLCRSWMMQQKSDAKHQSSFRKRIPVCWSGPVGL